MEGKRGSECLLKPVSNIDFNPFEILDYFSTTIMFSSITSIVLDTQSMILDILSYHQYNYAIYT